MFGVPQKKQQEQRELQQKIDEYLANGGTITVLPNRFKPRYTPADSIESEPVKEPEVPRYAGLTIGEWAERSGLSESTIRKRINEGWNHKSLGRIDHKNIYRGKSIAEWSIITGKPRTSIIYRMKRGLAPDAELSRGRRVTVKRYGYTVKEIAELTGMSQAAIWSRIDRNCSKEELFETVSIKHDQTKRYNGMTVAEIAEEAGVAPATIYWRIANGWHKNKLILPKGSRRDD